MSEKKVFEEENQTFKLTVEIKNEILDEPILLI